MVEWVSAPTCLKRPPLAIAVRRKKSPAGHCEASEARSVQQWNLALARFVPPISCFVCRAIRERCEWPYWLCPAAGRARCPSMIGNVAGRLDSHTYIGGVVGWIDHARLLRGRHEWLQWPVQARQTMPTSKLTPAIAWDRCAGSRKKKVASEGNRSDLLLRQGGEPM
jgi:hypothetical protein